MKLYMVKVDGDVQDFRVAPSPGDAMADHLKDCGFPSDEYDEGTLTADEFGDGLLMHEDGYGIPVDLTKRGFVALGPG